MTDMPFVFDTAEEKDARHPVANSAIVGVGAGIATLATTGLWLPASLLALLGGGIGYAVTGRKKSIKEPEAAE